MNICDQQSVPELPNRCVRVQDSKSRRTQTRLASEALRVCAQLKRERKAFVFRRR